MGKYQEVEVKFPLLNCEMVLREIGEMGLEQRVRDEIQNDTYYTPAHRDFLEPEIVSEWLRIRETNAGCSLNFKQWLPIGAKIQDQCSEYETGVADAYAMKKIMELLDIREIIVVNKTRNSWICEGVEISIDHVEALGSFIELEALERVDEEQIPAVHRQFDRILARIKAEVGERDRRGYPYLLLEKKSHMGEK